MKILRVRFKNLNSLVGEWEIDLTQPAFISDGIFAITGPTGAGKTTIFDAICLALYGCTPRLNKITKSENEIMSRQTGECFAEVTFATQQGRFRCHWSQHRARKKPDGELQSPKHEIVNADSGEIFESKIRGVAAQIEISTGMDFDRFTRSMLLAQGEFAAFLRAALDERSSILEQITGTAIYSQISICVHERRFEERKRLVTLQAELAGIQILTPEEEQQLSESLKQKAHQDTEITQLVNEKTKAIAWIESIALLEDELREITRTKNELHNKLEAFAPERERLRRANQALELSAEHAALTATRKEQESDLGSLRERQECLPFRADAVKQAEEAVKNASEYCETKKKEQNNALPTIRRVRDLDLLIATQDASIQQARADLTTRESSLENLQRNQTHTSSNLANSRKAFEELAALLTASKADGELVEHLTGLCSRFDTLKARHNELTDKILEVKQLEKTLQDACNTWQEQTAHLENENRRQTEIQAALSKKQTELSEILDGRDVADWRNDQSSLSTQKELIAKVLAAIQTQLKCNQTNLELNNQKAEIKQKELTLNNTLVVQPERRAALEQAVDQLETELRLVTKTKDLEEARSQLRDGESCPLCGSKEHPFAEGNIPIPDETQQRLNAAKAELGKVTDKIASLQVELMRTKKDLERIFSAQTENSEKINEANRIISDSCSKLHSTVELSAASDPMFEAKFKELQEENSRQIARVTHIIESAENLSKELDVFRESLGEAKGSVAKRELEAQTAKHTKDSTEQLIERTSKDAAARCKQQEEILLQLQQEIQPFGIETLSVDALDAVLEQLTTRRNQWVDRNKQTDEIESKITELTVQIRHQTEQLCEATANVKQQQEQLNTLAQDRESRCRERQELFGDKNADQEEKRLSTEIESAQNNLSGAQQKLSTAKQDLNQLNAKIDELENAIQNRNSSLKSTEETFFTRLQLSGFTDEENYKSACLPENERKQLTQRSQELSDENTKIIAKERDTTERLEAERQKKITEEPLGQLKDACAALVDDEKNLQREIGALRQKLQNDESLKQQQQKRTQAIDAQSRECSRWDLLHDLIGSADGKKYRNFAQGLTFEIMIGHANRQLQKMTDRYLLVHDDTQPLELNVIDNYQAGEMRSTKNLSGGESFIVSLSLALGLSHMASKKVRVDSLFLDEGFGTLDEEALDIALDTLAGLQQDGKLIGVISHVPALKERIRTQIHVTPLAGGRSQISGPGVTNASC